MDRNTPQSPDLSKIDVLPNGFSELVQHNVGVPYASEQFAMESVHGHSQPNSRYGTPTSQAHRTQGVSAAMQYHGSSGQLQGYQQQQSMFQHDNSPYGAIPELLQPYSTPATSPPTPSRDRDGSGKTLGPRSSRIEKAPAKKKKRPDKAKAPKNMPVLNEPMSQVKLDKDIPVANIEEYVNRSSEVRREEIEHGKNPGRVKRPMNAFMLYRKAYQLRAKEWADQHNHQVVSRVCGLSWPKEPDHIREQYKRWAELERDNHQKAHPDYKFTPSKPQKPQKYQDTKFDHHSDGSLDDFDTWAGRPGSRNRSTTKTPNDDFDSDYYPSRPVYGMSQYPLGDLHGMGMSSLGRSDFGYSNPGKPMPAPYDHRELAGQYYETHIRNPPRYLPAGMIEDVMMRKTPSPSLVFQQHSSSQHSHHGLGGGGQYHQQQHQQHQQQHQSQQSHLSAAGQHHQTQQPPRLEHRIDPSLMPVPHAGAMFDANTMFDSSGLGDHGQPSWHTASGNDADGQYSVGFLGLDDPLSMDHAIDQANFLRGNPNDWHREELPEAEQLESLTWADPPHKGDH
ncbi:hypothetical protein B0T19DRAFT_455022 [Cercophora scortea]|uniref:HMG box domain-containing protein n=1 Tax=Cercophora scortea TaxID=314031 RepID=A0AAE0MN73_9PEZI|nr:hypothetical protein B0T19DRAFT_455022 [Cercophora scortea]